MEELIKLYHTVSAIKSGCSMNNDQRDIYESLKTKFNELSGNKLNYSVCKRNNLLYRVKIFIDDAKNS